MAGPKIAYFDCYSGISGNMVLGALLDCGLELNRLQELLGGLKLPGYQLQVEPARSYGLAGTRVTVLVQEQERHRHLPEIRELIDSSSLPEAVKEKSLAVFAALARAEAAVHGIAEEEVHFHEVGAVDAIVDIVGSVAALFLLGVEEVCCSPLPVGSGMVRCAHGLLPLPAPATLELLKSRRVPVYGRETQAELVTPTGAALATALAREFGPLPEMAVEAVGYGAGSADLGYPNFLRVILGRASRELPLYEERVQVLEANIDDLNPEILGYLMEQLLEAGALDAYFVPIQMKKNRPAVKLTVLSPLHLLPDLAKLVFRESSTLGVRVAEMRKIMRARRHEAVETPWGPVRVKYVPPREGEPLLDFAPEYEDCLKAARLSGLPLKEVYRLVEHLFRRQVKGEE
ncbi:MAG TPA: nickel pincer cofactor biosynthesis protein LarC [Bacillota bacterium]|jgi:uncharacterized protein (TIGR00299 family) protein|nr:nickel pincer cofactor biosynthesis protein LarC [Bacillota bacterium]HOB87800.1 nickel pincer cofactor biosynthesis protein LarC [Bacillota bacterium]HOP69080.1 nickel pincer cofactor biosynthesis protein LarC [Bacillota bacterium]HPT34313.1 nickel pincer cofactor biosynthesis protein LarC [Bacillota bacterium]HPZ64805.1 nickel pincer cofactor biosynthesis protein LarC [Bacillota bacterium]